MQLTLLDIISDVLNTNLCEYCLQPCEGSIHAECSAKWWQEIVMHTFKDEE